MTDAFEPRNELEKKLVALHDGSLPIEEFMRDLPDSQVFMPVAAAQTEDSGTAGLAQPLALESEDGVLVMILFSSPDRSRDFVSQFSGYDEGGMLMDFNEALEKVGQNNGISINPGWDVGLDLDPEMVQQLVNEQAKKSLFKIKVVPAKPQ